jgi:DNA-binding NarL/FixJ family response regulator
MNAENGSTRQPLRIARVETISLDRSNHHGEAEGACQGIGGCSPSRSEEDERLLDDRVVRPITVMIASDRQVLLLAWMTMLMCEPGIELHAESITDPVRLGHSIEQKSPAVLLLDKAILDRLDGEAIQTIRARFENTRVLLLWDELCVGLIIDVLRYRFHGFLLTSSLPEAGLESIRAVSRGELWLSRVALANAIVDLLPASPGIAAAKPMQPERGSTTLTEREQQIVQLLRGGCTNKEIANRLGVVEDTVKKHLQSVYRKLGVHRRALVVLRPPFLASSRI